MIDLNKRYEYFDRLLNEKYIYEEFIKYDTMEKLTNTKRQINTFELIAKLKLIRFIKLFYMPKEIKSLSEISDKLLSPYNTFYDGYTLYCDESINDLTDQEYCEIMLNHILHFLLGFYHTKRNENIIISNIILAFSQLGIIKQYIPYGSKKRCHLNEMYKEYYKDKITFIIPDYKVYNYHMFNVTKTKLTQKFKVYAEEYILYVNISIGKYGTGFESNRSLIKHNKILKNYEDDYTGKYGNQFYTNTSTRNMYINFIDKYFNINFNTDFNL